MTTYGVTANNMEQQHSELIGAIGAIGLKNVVIRGKGGYNFGIGEKKVR